MSGICFVYYTSSTLLPSPKKQNVASAKAAKHPIAPPAPPAHGSLRSSDVFFFSPLHAEVMTGIDVGDLHPSKRFSAFNLQYTHIEQSFPPLIDENHDCVCRPSPSDYKDVTFELSRTCPPCARDRFDEFHAVDLTFQTILSLQSSPQPHPPRSLSRRCGCGVSHSFCHSFLFQGRTDALSQRHAFGIFMLADYLLASERALSSCNT